MKSGQNEEKLRRMHLILKEIQNRKTDGSILEFGVWEGASLLNIIQFIRDNDMKNKIYGFDSFCGLPQAEPNYKDGVPTSALWRKGMYASTLENTTNMLVEELGHLNNVTLIEGFYKDLTQQTQEYYNIANADLIHIDCDLVSSTFEVFEFCKNLIKTGTYIVFDEWNLGEDYVWETFSKNNDIDYTEEFPIKSYARSNMVVKVS